MIVPMQRVFVAARRRDAEGVVSRLRDFGVVHVTPVDPSRARPDEAASARLERGHRALRGLELATPSDTPVALPSAEAVVEEVDTLLRLQAERSVQRAALAQQVERTGPWRDTAPNDLEALARRGVRVRLFRVSDDGLDRWLERAAHIGTSEVLRRDARGAEVLLVSGARSNEAQDFDFEGGEEVPWPTSDRAALREEAAALAAADEADQRRLSELAHALTVVRDHVAELEESAEDSAIMRAGLCDEALVAYTGWVPEDRVAALQAASTADHDVPLALIFRPATDEESPPTLVRYPLWARPVAGLLDLLNTRPGYREPDIGLFFMVALPVFAALLIGDAVYGLLFVIGGMVGRRRQQMPALMSLMIVVGVVTVVWGVLVANYAGVSPETLARWAGFTVQESGEAVGDVRGLLEGGSGVLLTVVRLMLAVAPLYPLEANGSADGTRAQELIIMVSFCIGATHLVAARLSRAWVRLPGPGGWTEIGWALFLTGMLGIVWSMFFPDEPLWQPQVTYALLIGGAVMFVLFSGWGQGLAGLAGAGIAGNLLPVINTFSDTMSYIRLMAVGLASQYIAVSFNLLAEQVAGESHWLASLPVLIFGHALNIALCVIAIFAHGVRLNMLEFSSNAGVWWSGFAYAPLRRRARARHNRSSLGPGPAEPDHLVRPLRGLRGRLASE